MEVSSNKIGATGFAQITIKEKQNTILHSIQIICACAANKE